MLISLKKNSSYSQQLFVVNLNKLFYRFLAGEDPESYFSPTIRSRIVYEILATAVYGDRKNGEAGIERLLKEDGIYTAGFPLHEVQQT